VNFVTENTPPPQPQSEPKSTEPESVEEQLEVEEKPARKKRKRKNTKEDEMVSTINPDIKISKHDLDQIDVDNV